ncbi:MAG: DUF2281 domain-containing protein [Armatimonadetes bacterium]|nr:DUF2281 domain-containing protein [Armatimonadota bacterium]
MIERLQSLVKELPPEVQQELLDYAEFLHSKYVRTSGRPLRFDWEGALSHLRGEYTSVQLQHETLRLWGQ